MKTLRNTGFTFSDDLCVLPLIGDEVSQRQGGCIFDFFQHEARLRVLYAVVRQERVQNEMGKRVHIGKKRMEQVVGFAGQGEAAQYFGPFLHRLRKVFTRIFCLADGNADKRLQAQMDSCGGEQGGILADDACVFQLLQAAQAGRGGKRDPLG